MSDQHTIVFFDLETTGLDTAVCDIVQLSAISGERSFNAYAFPRCPITDDATRVTGFTVRGDALLLHGRPVDTVPLRQALSSFISFLRSFRRPLLLAAHNAKRFDGPILARVLQECSLTQDFQEVVSTFLDTFLLSKQLYAPGLARYSQEYLVRYFLKKSYDAHNALEDAKTLQELYKKWDPERWELFRCTFQLPRV
ncbi:DNA polymerase III PolC-type-like [Centroberyx affinis]|uniref:DNA polymerase III PolC-type-like n=1 Tax=Centroberyx affinis TaxID=166261 RepID=UPI003A5BA6B7